MKGRILTLSPSHTSNHLLSLSPPARLLSAGGISSVFPQPWMEGLPETLSWDSLEKFNSKRFKRFLSLLALIWGQSAVQQSEKVLSSLFGWEETKVWCALYSRGWIIDRGQGGSASLWMSLTLPPSPRCILNWSSQHPTQMTPALPRATQMTLNMAHKWLTLIFKQFNRNSPLKQGQGR